MCYSTARSYLAAIRHLHLSSGLQDPLINAERLGLALRGFHQRKPRGADPRLPITPLLLQTIGNSLTQSQDHHEQLLLWAACCLGFFAFLRSGELTTTDGRAFDPTTQLTPMDISFDSINNPSMLKVRLKSSKINQTQQGTDIYVGRTHNHLCPVVAMFGT